MLAAIRIIGCTAIDIFALLDIALVMLSAITPAMLLPDNEQQYAAGELVAMIGSQDYRRNAVRVIRAWQRVLRGECANTLNRLNNAFSWRRDCPSLRQIER